MTGQFLWRRRFSAMRGILCCAGRAWWWFSEEGLIGEEFCSRHKIQLALMTSSLGELLLPAGEITIKNKGDFLPIPLRLTWGPTIYASCSFLSLALPAASTSSSAGKLLPVCFFFTAFALKFHLTLGDFHPKFSTLIYLCIKAASQQKQRSGQEAQWHT